MNRTDTRVLDRKILAGKYCLVSIANPFGKTPLPGQFVHVRIEGAFLRRPFSICGLSSRKLSILFQIKGKGTGAFSRVKTDDTLDIIGPIGNHFPAEKARGPVVVVAGGVGVAPLLFLAERLAARKRSFAFLYGARTGSELLDSLLPAGDYERILTTDDGSKGAQGKVTDILTDTIERTGSAIVFASGPYAMLRKVAAISADTGVPAYVSLETRMFCGLGVCQGCVIQSARGYVKICSEGPVFNTKDIVWQNEPPV